MHNKTLDDLFAKCQQLTEDEFGTLLSAMMREQRERDCRKQKFAWKRVEEALTFYIKEYGDIIITDNRDGEGIVLSHGDWTCSPGLIEVE